MAKDRLTIWALDNLGSEPHKNCVWDQVLFVRGRLASILARTYEQYYDLWDVVGTHRSKSLNCPVFHAKLEKDGLKIWMRYNFYNWNVSIESERPITCDFIDSFSDDNYNYCYCEGMADKKFGTYNNSNTKFTVCIDHDYDLYTFFRVIRKHLGIKKED
jgi:hypothetical protein